MLTTRSSLLQRLRQPHNQQAWSQFFRLYSRSIHAYARARGLSEDEASDLTADSMHSLLQTLPSFQYDRTRGRFRSWLWRFVHNKISNYLHKHRPQQMQNGQFDALHDNDNDPQALWESKVEHVYLLHCLDRIRAQVPAKQYEAFRLYVLEEWPAQAVVDHLGVSADQVYLAKSRLIARLAKEMNRLLQDEPS